jgi:flavin-dependent dehydrogenase
MSNYDTDVLIVGGGPAGLSAAIAAGQIGLQALVVDIAKPPIDKACGEGLMPDSLKVLSVLGVSLDDAETGSFSGIRFVGLKDVVEARFPDGIGRGIRRTLLHKFLIDRATATGASLLWETRVGIDTGGITLNGNRIRYQWLVGADGNHSQVRRFVGLDCNRSHELRIGVRRHFKVHPWSEFVEIYWGEDCQAYVTPIAADQVCVALIARRKIASFESAISQFPALSHRLSTASVLTTTKGAATFSRRFPAVTKGNAALIGEASGSADAITGEGLAMCFRQTVALGQALAAGDLSIYEHEHRRIMQLPHMMGRAMLLMDKSRWIRNRSLRALSHQPKLFERMLSVHVGAISPKEFGLSSTLNFGWHMLTA